MIARRNTAIVFALMALLAVFGCAGPSATPAVVSVTIDDEERVVQEGFTLALTATVVAAGGAIEAVIWSSDEPGTAAVSSAGVITGVTPGEARITATSAFDATKSDTVTITVTQPPATPAVLSVDVDAGERSVLVGETLQLSTTVVTVGGASEAVTWTSDHPGTATVSSTGLVSGVAPGEASITATSVFDPSVRDSTLIGVVSVPPGAPARISVVTGDGQTAHAGSAVPIPPTVSVRDADEIPLSGVSVTFTVTAGNGAVTPTVPVTTDADGIAALSRWVLGSTAGANGVRATVTGSSPAISTTFGATAVPGPASPLTSTVTANPSSLLANGAATSQLTIRLEDALGNDLTNGGATVSFAAPNRGSIGAVTDHGNGTYSATYTAGTAAGTETITPRLDDVSFANTTTITLTAAVLGVTIDQSSPSVLAGSTLQLTATVDTIGGGSTSVTWTSSNTSVATVNPTTGLVSGVARGTTTITATSTADTSQRGSTPLTVVAANVPPVIERFTTSGPAASGGVVNPGLATTLSWATTNAETVTLRGPGLGAGTDVTGRTTHEVAALEAGAVYTLVAANDVGAVDESVLAARAVSAFGVLVAGQSNAQGVNVSATEASAFISADPFVQMLGNDYGWKSAYEPLDDCADQDQGDVVSADPFPYTGCAVVTSGVSFGVSLGNQVSEATGGTVFLIPAARGGSGASAWLPQSDRYDRSSLFGSAANRARVTGREQGAPLGHVVEGASYGAVVWFQGETDTTHTTVVNAFENRTRTILNAFRSELGAPTILVQLSRRGAVSGDGDAVLRNLNYQTVRETQRRLATGARSADGSSVPSPLPDTYLVVTHDLPLHPGDGRHLSAWAQRELGRRISLAIREHLFGETGVDGSGPQLVAVVTSGPATVMVHMDRPVRPPSTTTAAAYGGYFAVFSEDGAALEIASITRSGSDSRTVQIALAQSAPGSSVQVRYMPPPGIITELAADVIRSATCGDATIPGVPTSLCLPMAAFGQVADAAAVTALMTFQGVDDPE